MVLQFEIVAGPRQCSLSLVEPHRIHGWSYFIVPNLRLLQPGVPSSHIYIPQEQGGPDIPQGTEILKLKLKLSYDRRSAGQSVFVSGSHLEPMSRFFLSGSGKAQMLLLDGYCRVFVGRPFC
jgi:hypothetical protein